MSAQKTIEVLIIEDEAMAAQALQNALLRLDERLILKGPLQTIEESVEWFRKETVPDLVFMDIHLADGSAFEIFKEIQLSCPVIFCTAYDMYAIKAFEFNSVGYILKPFQDEALRKALERFYREKELRDLSGRQASAPPDWDSLRHMLQPKSYRRQFLIPEKDRLIPLAVRNVAYFFTEFKMVKAVCLDGSFLQMDHSLEELETMLDPNDFFRMNRQYIVQHQAISGISVWFNGKLALDLMVKTPERILISKARVADFKQWFAQCDAGE